MRSAGGDIDDSFDIEQEEKGRQQSTETRRLDQWLRVLVARAGSDLLLVPGAPACILRDGQVEKIEQHTLGASEIEPAVIPALSSHALKTYREWKIADSSYAADGLGRFRINLHRERGSAAAAVRALPSKVPLIGDLHLPTSVQALAKLPRGLVLIGGPAGSGKSTTMAALVNEINRNESRHVLIIEDPVEYQHTHFKSIIEQVEIGEDAPDFPTALRAALGRHQM